jgi:hypothetical protein
MQPTQNFEYASLLEDDRNHVTATEKDYPSGIFLRERMAWIILILLLLNLALSVTNFRASADAVTLLGSCEKKAVTNLPLPDPFIGLGL